jgi:hypothetical protein
LAPTPSGQHPDNRGHALALPVVHSVIPDRNIRAASVENHGQPPLP